MYTAAKIVRTKENFWEVQYNDGSYMKTFATSEEAQAYVKANKMIVTMVQS